MKQVYYIFFLTAFLTALNIFSQAPRWVNLTGYPQTNSRKDDVFFLNSLTGWVVTNTGFIHKTTDGGISWTQQFSSTPPVWLRCIGFIDSLNGFAGIFDTTYGGTSLLRTTNGGISWVAVNDLPNPKPHGLCSIYAVKNTQVIYACGRASGPALLLKSTNGGANWGYIDMNPYAACLVDCFFFTPDSGFVAGGTGIAITQTKPAILFTSDGGLNWIYRVNSQVLNQFFWKISFYSRLGGVAGLDNTSDSLVFFKTSDGGNNWERKAFYLPSGTYHTQGIGFVNANTGWLGGFVNAYTYETNDGGTTWHTNNFGGTINRMRFLNDTLGYAGGIGVYKYTTEQGIGIITNTNQLPANFNLNQNFPNPFNPFTVIKYDVPVGIYIKLDIYNSSGQKIRTLREGFQSEGSYTAEWDGRNDNGDYAASGIYFYQLQSGRYIQTRKMVLIK